jgi:starch phosphorylase
MFDRSSALRCGLGRIDPGDVQVEIYADRAKPSPPFRSSMNLDHAVSGSQRVYVYGGTAPADRPPDHYTPRIIPRHADAFIPLELPLIAWQK